MEECIFCQIIAQSIPAFKLYETDQTLALLDIFPSLEGHAMVIHKKHAETIKEYTDQELGELFGTVRVISEALEKTYKTKILTIGINHGEPMGVHHTHVHILPRLPEDGGKVIQSLVKGEWSGDLGAVAAKITSNIKKI